MEKCVGTKLGLVAFGVFCLFVFASNFSEVLPAVWLYVIMIRRNAPEIYIPHTPYDTEEHMKYISAGCDAT